ncbi:hypothetical protein X765_32015 [Mesorhizobium sp. LSHC440B00]|nr:hypothetical protein X765_32015 [Mesorhizobium sp. LSHC440B00]ESX29183.1 hypothetical protein X764_31915 [Mesorhizobium sp. LSHC440A00]
MHTGSLQDGLFHVRLDGQTSDAAGIFPNWGPHDRFGIVIHEPWGAIGASLLVQTAISEFFAPVVRWAAPIYILKYMLFTLAGILTTSASATSGFTQRRLS